MATYTHVITILYYYSMIILHSSIIIYYNNSTKEMQRSFFLISRLNHTFQSYLEIRLGYVAKFALSMNPLPPPSPSPTPLLDGSIFQVNLKLLHSDRTWEQSGKPALLTMSYISHCLLSNKQPPKDMTLQGNVIWQYSGTFPAKHVKQYYVPMPSSVGG